MVLRDPVGWLQRQLPNHLPEGRLGELERDAPIGDSVGWRPHLSRRDSLETWHILFDPPSSNAWVHRIQRAQALVPSLSVRLAVLERLLDEKLLEVAAQLNAAMLPFRLENDHLQVGELYESADELVWRQDFRLSRDCAVQMLDHSLHRTTTEENSHKKGRMLETTVALMLSQVEGYRVHGQRVRGRTEEFDLVVENVNVGGILGRGRLVLVECRNTNDKLERKDATEVIDKLRRRHGFSNVAFVVGVSGFTSGFLERVRESSESEHLIVPISGARLPHIWRSKSGITAEIESCIIEAVTGSVR